MYIKRKCLFLKKGIDPKELEKYGFFTLNGGDSYWLEIDGFNMVGWYSETNRFVYKYPKMDKWRYVSRFLPREVLDMTEVKPFWIWLVIIGRYRNYSDEKRESIERKIRKMNGMEDYDCD